MKKNMVLVVVLALSLAFAAVEASAAKKKTDTSPAKRSGDKQSKETLAQKRADLENTSWNIELISSAKGGQKSLDLLEFKDKQVSTRGLLARGFKPTNYTLTMGDDGSVIFETMQTNEKEGTIFWRGEFNKEGSALRGMVSSITLDQKSHDLSFSGVIVSAVPVAPVPAAAPAPAVRENVVKQPVKK